MSAGGETRGLAPRLARPHRPPGERAANRSSGAILLSRRTSIALLGVFASSIAIAQITGSTARPSVIDLLVKWTPLLARGFLFNLLISFCAMALGTVAGVSMGLARISLLRSVRGASWVVVQFFRNAPWLVLLFFVMYLLPFQFTVGATAIAFPDWIKATLGLALPIMANVAEIVRGAVQSIPTAQWDAARSLAFSRRQTLWKIILPQCVKRMLPPWMNLYSLIAMSTVNASIVGVSEMITLTAQVHAAEGSRPELLAPLYAFALACFFIYCYPIGKWTQALERRYQLGS